MFCSNCGVNLPEGSKFCFKCGSPVKSSVSKLPINPAVVTTTPIMDITPVEKVVEEIITTTEVITEQPLEEVNPVENVIAENSLEEVKIVENVATKKPIKDGKNSEEFTSVEDFILSENNKSVAENAVIENDITKQIVADITSDDNDGIVINETEFENILTEQIVTDIATTQDVSNVLDEPIITIDSYYEKPYIETSAVSIGVSVQPISKSKKALSIVLAVFLGIFGLIAPAFYIISDYFNDDLPEVVEKVSVIDLAEELDIDLAEEILNNVPDRYNRYNRVKKSDVENLLEDLNYAGLSDIAVEYVNAFADGNEKFRVKSKDIVAIIKTNEKKFSKTFNYTFDSETYETIEDRIDDNYELSHTSVHYILKKLDIAVWIPKLLLASYPYIIGFIIMFLLFAGIFALNLKRISFASICVAIPLLIAGLIYEVLGFFFHDFLFSGEYGSVIKPFTGTFGFKLNGVGVVIFAVGLLFLIFYIFLRNFKKKKA
ncbi:hypothetical protein FACS1894132_01950 [Clostridia bacterium]|nr:hypothetical protein FACS1894132_01950 [Clostridia bacterium]